MTNFIDHISIRNFKSIQSCELFGLKRINLFIGRPNVGKSNIIEGLSLFSTLFFRENPSKKLNNLLRIENEPELFYNGDTSIGAVINTNIGECSLKYDPKEGLKILIDLITDTFLYNVDDKLAVKLIARSSGDELIGSPIKRYSFKTDIKYKRSHSKYLIPPFGSNLLNIIENYEELKRQITGLFGEYGLKIVFDKSSQSIKVIQAEEKDAIFLIPYNSIADTLQRIIFYKAAIASNNNSVLLFEEPEAHAFPPYMAHLTQEMIYKKDNQFFIATHSPFILNDLLENGRDELAVFLVHYKDYETKIKQLTVEELHNVYQYGVDLFTNSESFI